MTEESLDPYVSDGINPTPVGGGLLGRDPTGYFSVFPRGACRIPINIEGLGSTGEHYSFILQKLSVYTSQIPHEALLSNVPPN